MDTNLIDPQLLFPRLAADRQHVIYQRDLGRHMRISNAQATVESDARVRVPMLEDIAVEFVQDRSKGFEFVREADRSGDEVLRSWRAGFRFVALRYFYVVWCNWDA